MTFTLYTHTDVRPSKTILLLFLLFVERIFFTGDIFLLYFAILYISIHAEASSELCKAQVIVSEQLEDCQTLVAT